MNELNEHDKLTQAKFDKWADNFEKRNSIFKYFQKRVISLINLRVPSNFLDLGCGTGWAVRYAASLLQNQGCFIGIDISGKMIRKANEFIQGKINIRFYEASAEELPLENNYFDDIICTFSFHHYGHPEKALTEALRVLKPGGKIFILDVTPDDPFIKIIEKLIQHRQKEHVKQYSSAEFKKMFSSAGLKYLKSKNILSYPIKVHIAEKE
jgi:ubiquinone/menaquinone biosynthesis C-methylase UbiE